MPTFSDKIGKIISLYLLYRIFLVFSSYIDMIYKIKYKYLQYVNHCALTFFRFSLQYKIIWAKLDNIRVKLYNKVYITLQ